MKRDRRRTLRIERLEGKALLSAFLGAQAVQTPTSSGIRAGAGASAAVPHSGLLAPTAARTPGAARLGSGRITPLDSSRLMSLSTMVSAGLAGEATRLAHPALAAAVSVPGSGLLHAPIHVGARGVGESNPIHVISAFESSSVAHAAGSASARVVGGGILGTHSASTAKIHAG